MSPLLALSWPKVPCALKAAIGIGKRTLVDPRQSGAPQRSQQGPFRVREPPPCNTRAMSVGASPAATPTNSPRKRARTWSGRLVLKDRLLAIRRLAATQTFSQRRLDLLHGLGLGDALHRRDLARQPVERRLIEL